MITTAHRIDTIKEYYFSKKLREVRMRLAKGEPIINLGIGSPDVQPPKAVVNALVEAMCYEKAHQYQSYKGLPELREAFADFYKKQFEVELCSETEVLPLMGSKEGIMHISMAFLNEGDTVLIPNPGYPTYTSVTHLVKATPFFYNLTEENGWLPDINWLKQQDLSKVKLMWLNYPHMPTGARVSKGVFKALIELAKTHQFLLVNDNPYSFILNDNPLSILNNEDAKDVCLELNSLSKTFNISGWRVGSLLGNANYIEQVLKVKTQIDSGMFYGIQKGAIAALHSSEKWFKHLNKIYRERKLLVHKLAEKLQCTYAKDSSGLFVWAKIPEGYSSESFSDFLLDTYHIFAAPGTVFGSQGEGYIRFSLCASVESIKEAISRIK